jgi:hypothetical protein
MVNPLKEQNQGNIHNILLTQKRLKKINKNIKTHKNRNQMKKKNMKQT